jgi:nitrite reductase/ring-hydroxylating ferredoxin subunit
MSEAVAGWRGLSTAPAEGTPVCGLDELAEGARCLALATDRGTFPLLVTRRGESIRAFVNACPHQYLPLDYRGPGIVSADGTRLICTMHGAMFDMVSGASCDDGLDALEPVPVHVDAARILRIGAAPDRSG